LHAFSLKRKKHDTLVFALDSGALEPDVQWIRSAPVGDLIFPA